MRSAALRQHLLVIAVAVIAIARPGGAAATAKLAPPVIHETFTPSPCPTSKAEGRTTLGMEGCVEQQTLRSVAKIDAVAKRIFARLGAAAARKRFVKAQRAWLTYRNADCASVADTTEGGTLAGVLAAQCTSERTTRHLVEIRAFERLLKSSG